MIIIPAIDVIDGQCVRLRKGAYDSAVSYNDDPVAMAVSFEKAGALRIHVVDLDAARGGPDNRRVIAEIRKNVSAVLEVGGGIRSERDVRALVDIGVDRLVLGTVLARNPDILRQWTRVYGRCFIAGIDARNGRVKTSGWMEDSGMDAAELAGLSAEAGAVSIIYTNIDKDGTLAGPDLEGTLRIAGVSGLPVILSGGIGGMADLREVCDRGEGIIRGVITGKALYEGTLSLSEALQRYQRGNEETQTW